MYSLVTEHKIGTLFVGYRGGDVSLAWAPQILVSARIIIDCRELGLRIRTASSSIKEVGLRENLFSRFWVDTQGPLHWGWTDMFLTVCSFLLYAVQKTPSNDPLFHYLRFISLCLDVGSEMA